MEVGVILSVHENSEVYRDTLDSVRKHLSDNVVVLIDGFGWSQFKDENVDRIEGFRHGRSSAPVRNVALGLMGAWDRWSATADWYCYMEYDCLVGSPEIKDHLRMANDYGYWMLGNDLKSNAMRYPFLDALEGSNINLHCFLGCCTFFSRKFMEVLAEKDFFNRLLHKTNFYSEEFFIYDSKGKSFPIHDPSEFIYPSLAVHYGGSVQQLAKWNERESVWEGNSRHYPMRFRPEISESDHFQTACVMHPLKEINNPVRSFHRNKRNLT